MLHLECFAIKQIAYSYLISFHHLNFIYIGQPSIRLNQKTNLFEPFRTLTACKITAYFLNYQAKSGLFLNYFLSVLLTTIKVKVFVDNIW